MSEGRGCMVDSLDIYEYFQAATVTPVVFRVTCGLKMRVKRHYSLLTRVKSMCPCVQGSLNFVKLIGKCIGKLLRNDCDQTVMAALLKKDHA